MKLFTKAILARLPALYSNEHKKASDVIVHVKLFVSSATWYITEYNPDEKLAFGFVNLGDAEMAELGYISITELEQLEVPVNVRHGNQVMRVGSSKVERDRFFVPCSLEYVMREIKAGNHV